jgi:hypothetical protein
VNKFTDTMGSFYVENKIQWASKFRSVLALRGDDGKDVVTSLTSHPYVATELPGAPVVNFRPPIPARPPSSCPAPKRV